MLRFIVLLCLACLAATPALAWGKTGHRVTGAIAQYYLSADAQAAVADILGVEDLAEGSTWADFMRSSPEPFWRDESAPYHYVTVPTGKRYGEVGPPAEGDAVTALQHFKSVLRNPEASRADKQLALRFTAHIIGDLHQPLHVGNGMDRGGNDIPVAYFDEETNLHRVWDSAMIDGEKLAYSEWTAWLVRRITSEMVEAWSDPSPAVWIAESASIREIIYPAEPDLKWNYVYDHIHIVRLRLSQGGVRIAAYLNMIFEAPERPAAP